MELTVCSRCGEVIPLEQSWEPPEGSGAIDLCRECNLHCMEGSTVELTIDRKDLLRALILTVRQYHRSSRAVLLEATEAGLRIHIHRDLSLSLFVDAKVIKPGRCAVDDKLLHRVIRGWTDRRIRLAISADRLEVWGDAEVSLPILEEGGGLNMDDVSPPHACFEMVVDDLRRMVAQILPATHPNRDTKMMHCAECRLNEGSFKMTATNGYMLITDGVPADHAEDVSFLAPSSGLQALLTLPFVKGETIALDVTHYHLRVKSSTFNVLLPIFHEKWTVQYEHLLHYETIATVTVDSLALRRHINLMRYAPRTRWDLDWEGLKLRAEEEEGMIVHAHIPCEFTGTPTRLYMAAYNLLRFLGQAPKQVKFEVSSPTKPVRICNGNQTVLIMPNLWKEA